MKRSDFLKVLLMLALAVVAVGLYLYARVDLGMSNERIVSALSVLTESTWTFAIVIWLQIAVAAAALVGYKIWRHRRSMSASER